MEQNTEASQAVDDTVERGKFVTEYLRYMAKEAPQSHPEMVYSMAHTRWGGIAGVMWRAGRAALKAQPAPTEAPKGPLEIPEPGNSNSLADRIFRLPCNWKGDHRLSAAIEMGHAMACEQAYDLAYEHAAQSPTEAAQGALSANPNLTTSGVTCQPVAAQGNTSNNSSSSQLSGNSAEAAQGEDSARLDYLDAWAARNKEEGWDEFQFGFNANEGTAREQIDQDRARASAETGGVKS